MKRVVRTTFLACGLASGVAHAEGLKLSDAIARARAVAPQASSAGHLAEAARARESEAEAGYLPVLNASAVTFTGLSGSSASNLGVRGMMASPFVDHYAAGVEGSWSLLEFLRVEPRVAAARAEERAAVADKSAIERDVAMAAIEGFERVLSLEARLASIDQDLASRKAQLAVIEAQVAGGVVADVELLQSRAGLARAAAERTGVAAEREAVRAALVVLTGDGRYGEGSLEIDSLAAAGERLETRIATARRDQAERHRLVGARELTPRVVVSASAGYANPAAGKDTGYYAVGAAVVLPLTSFVGDRARAEALAQAAQAQADAADARQQQIDLKVASLRATLSGAAAALSAADASEGAARAARDALDARVKAGAARAVEIEAARSQFVDTQTTAAVLRIRVRSLKARLALLGP